MKIEVKFYVIVIIIAAIIGTGYLVFKSKTSSEYVAEISKAKDMIIGKEEIVEPTELRYYVSPKAKYKISERIEEKVLELETIVDAMDDSYELLYNEGLDPSDSPIIVDSLGTIDTEKIIKLSREIIKDVRKLRQSAPLVTKKKKGFGFCFRPLIGIGYQGRTKPIKPTLYAGIKLMYIQKIGLHIGGTQQCFGIGASRLLDDIIPFIKHTNFIWMYGRRWKDVKNEMMFVGLAVEL